MNHKFSFFILFATFLVFANPKRASAVYDPTEGRWLSRDPIGEDGGINLYMYVGNNPIGWVDFYGLSPRDVKLIQQLFNHELDNMTMMGMRPGLGLLNAPISGGSQLPEDIWNSLFGKPLRDRAHGDRSCKGQTENLSREFQKYLDHQDELFNDKWTIETVQSFGHFYDVMHSSNPFDPDIHLDAFFGVSFRVRK